MGELEEVYYFDSSLYDRSGVAYQPEMLMSHKKSTVIGPRHCDRDHMETFRKRKNGLEVNGDWSWEKHGWLGLDERPADDLVFCIGECRSGLMHPMISQWPGQEFSPCA